MVTKNIKLLFFFSVWILEIWTWSGVISEYIFLSALNSPDALKISVKICSIVYQLTIVYNAYQFMYLYV